MGAPRKCAALALVAALLAGCGGGREREAAPAAAEADSLRPLDRGSVVGSAGREGGHAWLGIPFALPPVGALRWRAPQAPPPQTGPREALSFAAPCVQLASPLGGARGARPGWPTGSEDCLYLNVYAPALRPESVPRGDARLPVMFWIHGGGNSIGSAAFYDGSHLASERNVIVVTTQYRLGPFGWFRHAAVTGAAESADDRSGNFGLLDLVCALEWVRDHIAAFGGDPGNVTIFGESAGGTDVAMLLLSPRARGLFQRAVVESGGTRTSELAEAANYADDDPPGHPRSSRETILRLRVAEGLAKDPAEARAQVEAMAPAELAGWLRGLAAARVMEAYREGQLAGMIDWPHLFRDGAVLPAEEPFQVFSRPQGWNAVPTLLGTNRDEAKLFLSFSPEHVRRWAILPYLRDRERYERLSRYQSLAWKASGADELAAAISTWGTPAYVYRFDWDEEPKLLWSDFSVLLGAAHGFEIPFVFDHFDLGRLGRALFTEDNEPGRLALSRAMTSYWTEFAVAGDPDRGRGAELPAWQAWRDAPDEGGQFLVLDTPEGGGIRMSRETVTGLGLVQSILDDPSFESDEERCRLLGGLAARSPSWGPAQYLALPTCERWPDAAR
jgi:para-nitrobenzyl esterase